MPSIRSTIDVDFLEKLNALGRGSSSTGAALVQSIKGGEATESRVRKGLRSGAQYYAKALNGINYVGSLVNYARQDLEEMQKLTTSMAAFAEEASKEGTGTQRRRTLNRQFFSAAKRFLEINENAESNGRKYLTKSGVEEALVLIGLDPQKSPDIRNIMDDFVADGADSSLASAHIKGKDTHLPASAGRPSPAHATEELFRRDRNLLERADAQAVLDDLNALSGQIDTNLKNFENVSAILLENAVLVRATAVSMLSIEEEIQNDTEASKVATLLQQSIRRNARGALSQLDHLEPMAVAALTLTDETLALGKG
ncbi:MAG: hypothetical protein KDD64_16370 [Bdellovibrionales bacterium]|nr:hypothetical protein [Bdellovibrionales bacterium]